MRQRSQGSGVRARIHVAVGKRGEREGEGWRERGGRERERMDGWESLRATGFEVRSKAGQTRNCL